MTKNIFLLFFSSCTLLFSQQANDCVDAIKVCGNTIISTNSSGVGTQELDSSTNPCVSNEINSLWLSVYIETAGSLAFTLTPDNTAIEVDYDFYIFGPNTGCGNFDTTLRCSTTNPIGAGLSDNLTGLRDSEFDQNEGPGPSGNSFVSSIPATIGEEYLILINRPIGTGGFSLEWTGTAGFPEPPTLTSLDQPKDILVCDNQTNTPIDLTVQETTISTNTNLNFNYYTTFENAFDQQNEIVDPTQFVYDGNNTPIFVRLVNNNGCFKIVDFSVSTIQFPEPQLQYAECDGDRDNLSSFSIINIISDIEDSLASANDHQITLHYDDLNAIANTNTITANNLVVGTSTIYARVSSLINTACYITFPITLTSTAPDYPAVINLVQCDVDPTNSLDGITLLNLEQAFSNTLAQNVFFYETQAERTANEPITNPESYTNTTPFNSVVYYKTIQNNCETIGEIAIAVNATTASINIISPIQACDENTEDDILESTFNLDIIQQTYFTGLETAFYASLEDAAVEQNPLGINHKTESTTIYIRLENNNECLSIEALELLVNPIPQIDLAATYQFCTNEEALILEAPVGFDTHNWYKIEDNQTINLGTAQQLTITAAGNYRLEVTNQYNNNTDILNCMASKDFTITPSSIASFQNIEVSDTFNISSVMITVTGDGDYEYSLDGENYQNEPIFDRIEYGTYSVYVRDKNGCGLINDEFAVVGFPKFFTPNGDRTNDYWQIFDNDFTFQNKHIYIYDQYGKLVKQLNTNDKGWDGTYNGKPLAATEYWFHITLENGKIFKSHFSLKR